jgi:lambda family phage minor tail protein L
MNINTKIKTDIQGLTPGDIVYLFDVDATSIGGDEYHFCPYTLSGTAVVFNSITYVPLDCEVDGFELKGEGQLPRPKIKVSNTNLVFASVSIELNDLIGAKVTRRRTFKKYLDGQPEADPTAQFPIDVYYINRKVTHNKFYIEWELAAAMDFENYLVPKKLFLRDKCTRIYRYYVDGGFDYANVTCPYAGTNYYTAEGATTTAANDVCGRELYDCRLRFGNNNELPFGAFPGLSRIGFPYR